MTSKRVTSSKNNMESHLSAEEDSLAADDVMFPSEPNEEIMTQAQEVGDENDFGEPEQTLINNREKSKKRKRKSSLVGLSHNAEEELDSEVVAKVLDVDTQRHNGKRLLVTNAPLLADSESRAAIYDGKDELPLKAPRVLVDKKKRVIGYLPPQTVKRVHVVRCRYCNEQLESVADLPRHMIKKHAKIERCGTMFTGSGAFKDVKLIGDVKERSFYADRDKMATETGSALTIERETPALKDYVLSDAPDENVGKDSIVSPTEVVGMTREKQKQILTKVVTKVTKTAKKQEQRAVQVTLNRTGSRAPSTSSSSASRLTLPTVQLQRSRPKVIVEAPVVNEDGQVIRSNSEAIAQLPPKTEPQDVPLPQEETDQSESKTFIQFQDEKGNDHVIEISTAALLQNTSGTLFMDDGQFFVDNGNDVTTFETVQDPPTSVTLFQPN